MIKAANDLLRKRDPLAVRQATLAGLLACASATIVDDMAYMVGDVVKHRIQQMESESEALHEYILVA